MEIAENDQPLQLTVWKKSEIKAKLNVCTFYATNFLASRRDVR